MYMDNACQTADNPVIFLPEENRKKRMLPGAVG
jgi:hypothetical protein